jgi:hypothetical protein
MSDQPDEKRATVTRLDSGYVLVRWSAQVWAQWPEHRSATAEDFFQPSWSATPERIREASMLAGLDEKRL